MREEDGLAMSSRNVRLTSEYRNRGSVIHKTLQWAKSQILQSPISEIESNAIKKIEEMGLKPEYFSIVDGHKLTPVTDPSQHNVIVACTAAWAGEVRLIDNMILKGEINI